MIPFLLVDCEELAGVEDIARVKSVFDSLHESFLIGGEGFCEIGFLGAADAVFTADFSSEGVGFAVKVGKDGGELVSVSQFQCD